MAVSRVFQEVSLHCSTSEGNSLDQLAEHKGKGRLKAIASAMLPASSLDGFFLASESKNHGEPW